MDISLKMYSEPDLEICTEIYVDAFTAPPINYHWITHAKAERYIRDITKTPSFVGYVCLVDGEPAAFCFGILDYYFDGTCYEIREYAVRPQNQRLGLGSAFLGALESKLAGYDVQAISLHTSRNLPAFDFYTKNGYEEVKENATLTKWLS